MRIYLQLTKSRELIPFNYQPFLTGALHKWMGKDNSEHGKISLYSFSWLQNVDADKNGIRLRNDSYFFISAHDEELIKTIVKGVMVDPSVCFGASVASVDIKEDPIFSSEQQFLVASPVFVRRFEENNRCVHVTCEDEKSSDYLTETMQRKLALAGLPVEGVRVSFDTSYHNPTTKVIKYKNIGNRVNFCPVIIKGTPEQVAFAWNVDVGNSTGIGFGALK
jgi:CRISPR-associated endoribonuclease Cas6